MVFLFTKEVIIIRSKLTQLHGTGKYIFTKMPVYSLRYKSRRVRWRCTYVTTKPFALYKTRMHNKCRKSYFRYISREPTKLLYYAMPYDNIRDIANEQDKESFFSKSVRLSEIQKRYMIPLNKLIGVK